MAEAIDKDADADADASVEAAILRKRPDKDREKPSADRNDAGQRIYAANDPSASTAATNDWADSEPVVSAVAAVRPHYTVRIGFASGQGPCWAVCSYKQNIEQMVQDCAKQIGTEMGNLAKIPPELP